MTPLQLFDPASNAYTYVLHDPGTREALIIDPVAAQWQRDLGVLQAHGLTLRRVLQTQAQADPLASAALLAEHTGALSGAPFEAGERGAAVPLAPGAVIAFGGEQLCALVTPGHSAGPLSYRWRGHVFTGDALLIGDAGRTDLPSGRAAALYHDTMQMLFALPDDTLVWPGREHHGRSHSCIGTEKAGHARLAGRTQAPSVAPMESQQLPPAERPAEGYAGDVAPALAWQWVQSGAAVLVDVRSDAEREWVGCVPGAAAVAWKQWPGMDLNPDFDAQLRAAVPPGSRLVLLCRSGVRSVAAARRATDLGFTAYNILEGFEGAPDSRGQRGHGGGWRWWGLPWRQG